MNTAEKTLTVDVLVVGGGTSGCLAALAAARENVRVAVLESESALGGVATRAGIHRYYYGSPGGLQEELDRETEAEGKRFGGRAMGFHPEARRTALGRLFREAGIRALLSSTVYEALVEDKKITGVRAVTPEGPVTVRAAVTIDASGNGSVVRLAGGAMRYGRAQDGVYHNYSLVPRRIRDGLIGYDNSDAGWVDPYDPWDVTRAHLRGREWIGQAYAEGLHYYGISSALGYREGGLIEGEKRLTIDEYIEDASLPDVISRSYSHLDNHGFDTGNESDFSQIWISILGLFSKGLWCDIPYGALLPETLEGVLVACRALSVDRDVSMGVRMQRDMFKVGEAAGLAAALSVKAGTLPRAVNVAELQRRLVERGVLEATDLNRRRSRNLEFRQGPLAGITVPAQQADAYAEPLASYFGTDEQWKAVWLLARRLRPESALPHVLRALEQGSPAARMCAAIVLALRGRREQEPYLLERLRMRDATRLSEHPKCLPTWVAALILLRITGSAAATEEALRVLDECPASVEAVFVLAYLKEAAGRLSDDRKRTIAEAVYRFAKRPELGGDYLMHGSRPESLRWSLELRAAETLAACGAAAHQELAASYAADRRGYARGAARLLQRRLAQAAALPEPVATGGELRLGDFDAAVVGGGLAGVVCAAALSRAGGRVLLVERSGALLTEATRSRMTRWPETPGLMPGGEAEALLACLRAAGALRDGEVEPVLAQLAADRYVQEAGVTVLFEADCMAAERDPADGRRVLRLALKHGLAEARACKVIDCTPDAALLRQTSGIGVRTAPAERGIATSTLVFADGAPALETTLRLPSASVDIRLRPSLYEGEVYLDMAWRPARSEESTQPENASENGRIPAEERIAEDGLPLIGVVLDRLRAEGLLTARTALAYIADAPWPLPAVAVDLCPREGTGSVGSRAAVSADGAVIGAGLWLAAIRQRLDVQPPWRLDAVAAAELLQAGEEAAQAARDGAQADSKLNLRGRGKH